MSTIDAPVLLIDDTADDVFLIERLLRFASCPAPLTKFSSPVDAVDCLSRMAHEVTRPCACFVDVRMPQLNGFEVATWIRGHPEFNGVPVVLISSSDELCDLMAAQKAGADCYLKKFPSVPEMQAVWACALQFKDTSKPSNCSHFELPCNLLSTLPPISHGQEKS
jgi:CheY-like chemotaxis protein